MINLTVLGYTFMHSAMVAICKAAESISNSPERVRALILCPNTGSFGDSYSDLNIMNATNDVEDLLKDPDLGITYRRVGMSFDETTIPSQS